MYRYFIFLLAMAMATSTLTARDKQRSKHREDHQRRSGELHRGRGRTCLDRVRGLGTQWIGEQGALDAAKKDWMERVRYYHGETFLDLSHSSDFAKRCGRVSIGEVAGQVLYRCEIEACPCKAVLSRTSATLDESAAGTCALHSLARDDVGSSRGRHSSLSTTEPSQQAKRKRAHR